MKKAIFAIAALMMTTSAVFAQDRFAEYDDSEYSNSDQPAASVTSRPYYSDRHATARQAIHQRAAWKAAQRSMRIESYKWYGYSPSRPPASSMPSMGSSATWIGPIVHHHLPGIFYFQTAGLGH